MKKNILILLLASYGGGAENEVLDYVKNYDNNKFKIYVITLRKGNIEDKFQRICRQNKVEYKCLNSKMFFSIFTYHRLSHFIKKRRIDILHANLFQAEFYTYILRIFNDSLLTLATKHAMDDFKMLFPFKIIEKIFSKYNSKTIVVSKALFYFYKNTIKLRPKKMAIIYNGIDVGKYEKRVSKETIKNLKKEINIDEKDFVVGIVSRIEKGKNHLNLIKAIGNLKKEIRSLKLLIIGRGDLEKCLRKYVKKNNLNETVRFLGYKENIIEYYHMMNVFCLPSKAEGFGRVNAEAILCGSFVITSNTTAMKEVIRDNVDGFLINPEDIDQISKKILWVYNNRAKAKMIVKEGQKSIKERFGLNKIIKDKEKIYNEIVRENNEKK